MVFNLALAPKESIRRVIPSVLLKQGATLADNSGKIDCWEDPMEALLLALFHIAVVTAVYITAYRTGYKVCEEESRRQAAAYAAPLTEMLERLNLDIESFLDDRQDR